MITIEQRNQLHKQLMEEEGFSAEPYMDQTGNMTIGYGHNLEARPLKLTYPISKDKGLQILDSDIDDTIAELVPAITYWQQIDAVRQVVLIDMAFNMGVPGLLKFDHMLRFLREGYYSNACTEMWHSQWAHQVQKSRVDRLVKMMERGKYV